MITRIISVFSLLVAAGLCHVTPAAADEISELQEAIRQQRILLEEQSLRLEALESRLADVLSSPDRRGSDVSSEQQDAKAGPESEALRNKITITGTLNELVMRFDDGYVDSVNQASNDNFPTRLVFRGVNDYSDDWAAGFWMEVGISAARSSLVSQLSDGSGESDELRLRRASIRVKSDSLGELRLGKSMPATRSIILAHADDAIAPFSGPDAASIGGGCSSETLIRQYLA
jgi:hypothetical protein